MATVKTTIWIDTQDNPLITPAEDFSVSINASNVKVHDDSRAWEIRLDHSLFPQIRKTMDEVERMLEEGGPDEPSVSSLHVVED